MIDSILVISLLFSLDIVGYTYNNLYNKKFYVNLPGILIGFVVLLVFGSLLSVLSFQQVSNSMVWKISYLFLTLFSLIFIIYCFTWSPKTVITGDIGSFPLYRAMYKIYKTFLVY